jgi:hypothetical protein
MSTDLTRPMSSPVNLRISVLQLLAILLLPQAAAVFATPSDTQFDRLITSLNTAPFEERQEFASLALSRLADAYLTEVEQARSDSREERSVTRQRWSSSVEQFVNRLLLLKSDIDMGLGVTLGTTSARDVVIEAGGQSVMLSYPRPREQRAFEQQLLESFCRSRACETLSASDAPRMPERPVVDVRPGWTFATDRIECRHRGLTLVFAEREYSDRLRQFCSAAWREAEILSSELRKLVQFGMAIEWEALAIRQMANPAEQVVELNAARDSIPLSLPTLQAYPKLLSLLQPWLQAQLEQQAVTLSLKAADFGWNAASVRPAVTTIQAGHQLP